MSTGTGASMVLSEGVPEHPCLPRFEELVSYVGLAKSGNVLNDIHRRISILKSQARVAPGVYDVKKMRQLLGEDVEKLRKVVQLCKVTEDLTVANKMPRPPPVKDFYSRFEPEGVLRDLGTGNGAKADDSGIETVGYEDHMAVAPDVLMDVRSISEYSTDIREEDATSSFLAYTSSYNTFDVVGDALHVFPCQEYMMATGLSTKREDGLIQCGEYVDRECLLGEAITPGYRALLELKNREVSYRPVSKMETAYACASIGQRIVSAKAWEDLEKEAIVSYKYDGRRMTFRQNGKDAYLIDSGHTIKFCADKDLELDLDMELVGKELVLTRVNRVGPIRPYDTYQAINEFIIMTTLHIPGFEIVKPEFFDDEQYLKYLASGRVDGKVFRRYCQHSLLKHHMSLDFRTPVNEKMIESELREQGFRMSGFVRGPGFAVEEYEFRKNEQDSEVFVAFKTERNEYKRTDDYSDISQINWPTTEKKPAGLEKQPEHHVDEEGGEVPV